MGIRRPELQTREGRQEPGAPRVSLVGGFLPSPRREAELPHLRDAPKPSALVREKEGRNHGESKWIKVNPSGFGLSRRMEILRPGRRGDLEMPLEGR